MSLNLNDLIDLQDALLEANQQTVIYNDQRHVLERKINDVLGDGARPPIRYLTNPVATEGLVCSYADRLGLSVHLHYNGLHGEHSCYMIIHKTVFTLNMICEFYSGNDKEVVMLLALLSALLKGKLWQQA